MTMSSMSRPVHTLVLSTLVVCFGCSDSKDSKESKETGVRVAESPAVTLTPECQKIHARLKKLRAGIPFLFIGLSRPVSAIDSDIKEAIQLGERFRESCGENPQLAWVTGHLGRDYLSRIKRYLEARRKEVAPEVERSGLPKAEARQQIKDLLRQDRLAYLARIGKLAKEALDLAAEGTEARFLALSLMADLAEKNRNHGEQARYARLVIQEFPDSPRRSKYLQDVAHALSRIARSEEAARWMREVIDKYRNDPEYVLYNGTLFEILNSLGDLEGMEDLMWLARTEYPGRMDQTDIDYLRAQYEQWYDLSGFWIGFVRYALGDVDGAKEALRENINYLDAKEATLIAQGKNLPNVQSIIRDLRSREVLQFLEKHHGKPAKSDFSAGIRWATERKLDLVQASGQLVPVLFRKPGDPRCLEILLELDEYDRHHDKVSPINLAFFPNRISENQAQQRIEKLRQEHSKEGVQLPAGFDMTENQRVFRSVNATVGTATFILYDGEGRPVWYLQDPRNMDRMIVKRVMDRLLESS